MNRLPVLAITKSAYGYLFKNWRPLLPALLLASLISAAGELFLDYIKTGQLSLVGKYIYSFGSPDSGYQGFWADIRQLSFDILLFIFICFIYAPIAIALLRNVIADKPLSFSYLRRIFKNRELYYDYAAFKFSMIFIILGISSSLLSYFSNFLEEYSNVLSFRILVIGTILILGIFVYLGVRVGFIFADAAMDKAASLKNSFRMTRGYTLKLIGLNCMLILPALILPLAIECVIALYGSQFLNLCVVIPFTLLEFILGIPSFAALGLAYKHLQSANK